MQIQKTYLYFSRTFLKAANGYAYERKANNNARHCYAAAPAVVGWIMLDFFAFAGVANFVNTVAADNAKQG
jgi:hypothetical protein